MSLSSWMSTPVGRCRPQVGQEDGGRSDRTGPEPGRAARKASRAAVMPAGPPTLGTYGAVDCGAYVGNFMLAAQALGLGTIPQAALARHSGLIRRHFNLGDDRRVVCGISFGYADHDHKVNSYRTSRAPLADVVTFVGD